MPWCKVWALFVCNLVCFFVSFHSFILWHALWCDVKRLSFTQQVLHHDEWSTVIYFMKVCLWKVCVYVVLFAAHLLFTWFKDISVLVWSEKKILRVWRLLVSFELPWVKALDFLFRRSGCMTAFYILCWTILQ